MRQENGRNHTGWKDTVAPVDRRHDRPLECLQKSKTPSHKLNINIHQELEFNVSIQTSAVLGQGHTPVVIATKEAEVRGSLEPRS